MNPSRWFIKRPIATSLIMLAFLLTGIVAYPFLPVSSLPDIDYPTIQILTFYPGASPDVMATAVTAPLEHQLGQMTDLNQMTSSSSQGASMIRLQFNPTLSLDIAEQEVQAAINAASRDLPSDLPTPPIYRKVNPADIPIVTLAFTSQTMPLSTIEDSVETRLAPKLSQLPGVGWVTLHGGHRPAVRIQVNPTALAHLGLNFEDVRSAINATNVNAPKGSFDGPHLAYTILANDQLLSSQDYKPIILAYKNNAPVRLSDIANVTDSIEDMNQAAWKNHDPAILIDIQRQPGANAIAVADHIQQGLSKLRATLPKNIDLSIVTDRTDTIRASIHDVQHALILAVFLVIGVIFLFLRNLPATFIPSITVPLSLIGTFGVMYLMGLSINNLTLMALTISAGFVVDDAIVMIENISRYIEAGQSPLEAALRGSGQIAFTILSLTLSLIAVFIPLFFMTDLMGRLFREFALTVSITLLISAIISLTLTPMLCATLLHFRQPSLIHRFEKASSIFLKKIIEYYRLSLCWVLAHALPVLIVAIATLFLSGLLLYVIPSDFIPPQDTGLIQGISEASQSISFDAMAKRQQALGNLILKDPAVLNFSSYIGIDGVNTSFNTGRFMIALKPHREDSEKITEVMQRLQTAIKKDVPGMRLYLQPVRNLSIDTDITRTEYQLSLSSVNGDDVSRWSSVLLKQLQNSFLLTDVNTDQQNHGLQTRISIDRPTATRLGITPQMIDDALYDAFGQRQIETLYTQRNQYHVILEANPSIQTDPLQLQNIYLTNTNGKPIPLRTFTTMFLQEGPLVIHRQNQFPSVTLSFNLANGVTLGEAIHQITKILTDLSIPPDIHVQFEGSARVFQNTLNHQQWLMIAAILVVYIILGVLYESLIHPITILSTLPSATLGALLLLIVTKNTLNVVSFIGILLLIGLVMKNAILMIDFALEQERQYQKSPLDAIYEAAMLRFRPIVMTTFAAFFGAIPLAFSTGIGSELRKPLGIAIMGGLAVSQLLTLYTTPILYLAFDRAGRAIHLFFKKFKRF